MNGYTEISGMLLEGQANIDAATEVKKRGERRCEVMGGWLTGPHLS